MIPTISRCSPAPPLTTTPCTMLAPEKAELQGTCDRRHPGRRRLARGIDVDRLPLREKVSRYLPLLAGAARASLCPAERHLEFQPRTLLIDLDHSHLDVTHKAERPFQVACEEARREAKRRVVCQRNRFLIRGRRQQGSDRPKDLLADDPTVG